MKKIVYIIIALFTSIAAFSQPSSNLSKGLFYRTTKGSIPPENSLIKLSNLASYQFFKKSTSSEVEQSKREDTVFKILPDTLRKLDSVIVKLKLEISKNDSILKLSKQLKSDTSSMLNKDTLIVKRIDSMSSVLKKTNNELNLKVKKIQIEYNEFLSVEISKLKEYKLDKITTLTNAISREIDSIRMHKYNKRLFMAINIQTEDTTRSLSVVQRNQDSIFSLIKKRTTTREFYKRSRKFTFIPALSSRSAKYFYGDVVDTAKTIVDSSNFYLFQNLNTFTTTNKGVDNTTLHATLFSVYAGPIRFEAHSYFGLPKNTSKEKADSINAISQLAAGGGNISLNFNYPLISYNVNSFADIHFSTEIKPKVAFDVPKSDTMYSKTGLYGSLALNNTLSIGIEKKVTVVGEFSVSRVWPNSRFMDLLGFTGLERSPFMLSSYSVGLLIGKSYCLRYIGYITDNDKLRSNLNGALVVSKSF